MSDPKRFTVIRDYFNQAWKDIKTIHENGIASDAEFETLCQRVDKQYIKDVPEEYRESIRIFAQIITQEAACMLNSKS